MTLMDPEVDPEAPTRRDPQPGAAGRTLGGYRLLRELGRGGMGVVYLAHDDALQRDVALKVLQPSLAKDPEFEQRFVREARTAAKLDHPNVVPVYSAGRDGEVLFMAMRFVPGRTLHALMKERGRLPVREALEIVRQAARGLGAAHAAALVHRDVKPHNLMIDEGGTVKVMDFGLMRSWRETESITEPGVFYGTPEYASPEQCEGGEMDGRADLYSLGAVLYEMLGGRRPHAGNTPMALFKKILEEPPEPLRSLNPEVPPAVEALVSRMMAKRPEDRFASMAELEAALDALPSGAGPKGHASSRRSLAAALLLAGVAAGAWWAWSPAPAAAPPSDPAPAGARLRLVVFDLKNGIPKPESAWYSIALSDLLIAGLSKQPMLDVPTRDQLLWTLKQRELEGQAGDEERRALTDSLGARAYLSGSYYVQGPRLRLTLTAYRLPENAPLFPAKAFDGEAEDLLGLADRAAGELARALGADEAAANAQPQAGGEQVFAIRRETVRKPAVAEAPAPPPAPQAGKGDARPAELGSPLRALRDGAPSPGDWMRSWYENRKAIEGFRLKKEDFEALSAQLSREFAAKGHLRKDQKPEKAFAGSAGGLPPGFEFGCPSCGKALPGLVPCPECRRPPLIRPKR
jgi:TolB-like protein